jgi:hypothetical protein
VTDTLAALDAIPREQVPAAIALLSARLLTPEPAPEPAASEEWLTAADVAALLKVPEKWAYSHQKELGAAKLGRRALRFPARRVRRFAEGRTR